MFEKEIELAPPGSDRKASFTIAEGIVKALNGIEEALSAIYVQMGRRPVVVNEAADQAAQPEQTPVSLDPPAEAFPKFDSGETFEEAGQEGSMSGWDQDDATREEAADPIFSSRAAVDEEPF